jgi:hypothetical protein
LHDYGDPSHRAKDAARHRLKWAKASAARRRRDYLKEVEVYQSLYFISSIAEDLASNTGREIRRILKVFYETESEAVKKKVRAKLNEKLKCEGADIDEDRNPERYVRITSPNSS